MPNEPGLGLCLVVFAGACALSGVLTWVVLRIARSIGARQIVRDDGPQAHLKKQGTPSLGGVGLIAAFVAVSGAALSLLPGREGRPIERLWPVLAATLAFGLIGFYDDYCKFALGKREGWKARYRIIAQIVVAALFAALWFEHPSVLWMFSFAGFGEIAWRIAAAIVLVSSVNAVNLTDGLDGLAAGLSAICAIGLGVAALAVEQPFVSLVAFALAGACVGFLWHNGHPATIFMGDVGSYGLGGALAAIALAGAMEVLYALMGGIFVVEALSVMGQVISFRMTGRRILKMAPLHHHFELCGWPETRIVVRFYIIGIALAVAGLCALPGAGY